MSAYPAPWRLDGGIIRGTAASGKERPIAEVYREVSSSEETIANARLIVAAPDLHAALIAAKQHMWREARSAWSMSDFKNWAVIQQIDAALEKADGHPRTEGR